MSGKPLQTVLLTGAGVIALAFVKLMFDMSSSMGEMTGYMSVMSEDVGEMQQSMNAMNDSMQRMEKSIDSLGKTFSQGSKQFQQMNPAGMLQQVLPDSGQRTR